MARMRGPDRGVPRGDQTDDRYRLLFEHHPDEIMYIDRWGTVVDVNGRIEDLFGIPPSEAIGKKITYFARFVKISVSQISQAFQDILLKKEREVQVELDCVDVHGRPFVAEFSAVILREGSLPSGLLVTVRDISEKKKQQAAIADSQHLIQSMLNVIPDMVVIIDRDYNVLYSNWSGFANVPLHRRVLPSKCYSALRERDCPCADCRAHQVFHTGEPFHEQVRIPEGLWIDLNVLPIRDARGGVEMVVEWVRDVTEIKQATLALQQSEERLGFALSATNDGLWDWDLLSGEAYFSPSYYTMLGYAPGELPGSYETWRELLHPDDLPRTEQVVWESIAGRREGFSSEFRLKTKTGGWRWILGRGKVVERDPQGRPARLTGTHTDITERVEAERERARLQEQLTQALRMESIGRLAGGVAHDFNNLLTVISGNASLAMLDVSPGSPLREPLDEIVRASDSAASLTRQLLAFSRKQATSPERLDLNALIEQSTKMLRRLIGENASLSFAPEPGLSSVLIDAGQVEQILVNLVVNARDALPKGGRIGIETASEVLDEGGCRACDLPAPGDYVVLGVSDDGVGMSPEVQRRVFEPFFTTKAPGKGTGLGLSTVYGIAKHNGGAVVVDSAPGQGSRFRVYLPASQGGATPSGVGKASSLPQGDETILLVEDDPAVRALASRVLSRQGYQILAVGDGEQALARLDEHPGGVHLLLTDVVMPGLDGFTLADRVVAREPGISVVFSSGYAEDVLAQHGSPVAGAHFLGKPYSPAELARKVREVLDEMAKG